MRRFRVCSVRTTGDDNGLVAPFGLALKAATSGEQHANFIAEAQVAKTRHTQERRQLRRSSGGRPNALPSKPALASTPSEVLRIIDSSPPP